MLEKYIKIFANLRTDKGRDRYPQVTLHRAPHKPFLLLSIMDLISQGQITEKFIEPSLELVDTFNTYWSRIMPPGSTTSMAYPFSRLKTDGFWQRITKPNYDPEIEYNVKSMRRFREIYLGAKMEEELFHYFCDPKTREQLRTVLIDTYFAPEVRLALVEQGRVNYEAFQYGQTLLRMAESKAAYGGEKEKDTQRQNVRDQAFRKTVVTLYDHRCAMCGIRMLTPDGHTVVQAAHVKPWRVSYDDRPTNGMALCRLCHWYFDEGLMSVGKAYEVLVSKRVHVEQNLPGHILTLSARNIFTPTEQKFWPAQENLEYHRRKAFLK